MLTVSPLLWANQGQITVSFVPDGTDIAGQESTLFESFGKITSPSDWQAALLQAFQSWSDHVAVDFGVVSDAGLPLGVAGPRTDDLRFGDIRIGAIDMATDVAAVSISDSAALSGTWSGEIVFNTAADIATVDSIYAVTVHEAGHLLGLTHSELPDSVMHEHGNTKKLDLSKEDIQAAIAINGRRGPDLYDTPIPNDSLSSATFLAPLEKGFNAGTSPILIFADLNEPNDVDTYQIDTSLRVRAENGRPSDYRGSISVRLQTSGLSLLSPTLMLLDKNGDEIGLSRSSATGGATLNLQIDRVDPGAGYFVRIVASDPSGAFSVGGYSLTVMYDDLLTVDPDSLKGIVIDRNRGLTQDKIHHLLTTPRFDEAPGANDSIPRAEHLVKRPDFEFATYFDAIGTISEESSADFYRFSTPLLENDFGVLTTIVRSYDDGRLIPAVTLYDIHRNVVPSRILANGGGELVVQTDIQSNAIYFAQVTSADAVFSTGNYALNMSFGHESVQLESFFATQLDVGKAYATDLYIGETQLFHFALYVDSDNDSADFVAISLVNENGQIVNRISGVSGDRRSSNAVLLEPGAYEVLIHSFGESDQLTIQLDGIALSDPFVVEPEDAIDEPMFACPDTDEVFCYPGEIRSDEPYLWDDFIESLEDPPEIDTAELIPIIIGDWWMWYWRQQDEGGPVLGIDDFYQAHSGQSLVIAAENGVLVNDIDPESEPFIAVLLQGAQNGVIRLSPDGSFRYTSEPGFLGTDSFTYAAHDFNGESKAITVSIDVGSPIGDFDGTTIVDARDIDLLCAAVPGGAAHFDLDGDGRVAFSDFEYLVEGVLQTSKGDANLDGAFDSSDLIMVFAAGFYESNSNHEIGWQAGDWNCDGVFDSTDLVDVFREGYYEGISRATKAAVASRILSEPDDQPATTIGTQNPHSATFVESVRSEPRMISLRLLSYKRSQQ